MSFRLVVCVDIEAETVSEAYEKTCKFMKTMPSGMDWESTDEWFDQDGEQGSPATLTTVRQLFLENH